MITVETPRRPRLRPGVLLGLLGAGLLTWACRAGEGDRCICGDDCRAGLVCLAEGRVLANDECNAVVGPNAAPGQCVDEAEAGIADDGGGGPEVFMDLGSKRDFDPGLPPDPDTESGDTQGSSSDGSSSSGSPPGTTGTDSGSSSGSTNSGSSGGSSSTDGGSTDSGSSGGSSSGGSSSGGSDTATR